MSPILTALAALIDTTRVRLYREDTLRGEWQTIPSLWDQLISSSQWGNGDGGSAKFGSRPVISTGVVSLTMEITQAAKETAAELTSIQPAGPKRETARTTPENLRYIAATLTDAELIGWWTEQLRSWSSQARNTLRLDPPRPRSARGTKCPDCGADSAYTKQDGETVRIPALAITWVGPDDHDYHPDSAWKVRAVECRQCGVAWFRGDSLNTLIDVMMIANQTQETMTDGVA